MKGLADVYTVFIATVACVFISSCSSDFERTQSRKQIQRSSSSSAILTLEHKNQEPTLLQDDFTEESVSPRRVTYVF